MKHLHRRLQKLEMAIGEPENWSMQLLALADCARRKLASADRDILNEAEVVLDRVPYSVMSETQQAVWQRWEDAFDRAVEETGCPYALTAADLRL